MPASAPTEPVRDSIAKVNDELAVGSDLEFQRRWWKFERGVWIFFTLLIVLDVLGVFGRGPLAKARLRASDGSVEVTYERVERHGTPSLLTVHFGPGVIQDGKVRLWVSDDLVKVLGNQRVSPQPESSTLERGGILCTFPAGAPPLAAQFSLQPTSVGAASIAFLGLDASGSPQTSSSCHSDRPGVSVYTVLHAIAGYLILLLTLRALRRSPGAQMTL